MIHKYTWNAARAASQRPLRCERKWTYKLVGPGQFFIEDDGACRHCGYHLHAPLCPDFSMNLQEAEAFLRADPENNGVVALDGNYRGRVYFYSNEGTFMFLHTNGLRMTAYAAKFPFVDAVPERNAERRFRRATELDHKNSR